MKNFWNNILEFWQDSVNLLLGVWLVLSAWVLQFTDVQAAFWNAVIFGLVITAGALSALVRFRDWEEWADIAIGAWLIVSPWILGFASFGAGVEDGSVSANWSLELVEGGSVAATWNFVLVGIVTLSLALWSIGEHRRTTSHTG